MKKLIVGTVLVILSVGISQAQLRFGIIGGANATGFYSESIVDELTPQLNFHIGGMMQYDFWIFTIQPELLYIQKGGRLDNAFEKNYLQEYVNLTADAPALRYTSSHIELPVNLIYKVNIGKTKVFAQVGPHLTFNLGGSFNGSSALYSAYAKDFPFRWINYGVGAGAGVEYKKFQLSAKYDWSFNWLGSKVPNLYDTGNLNLFNDLKYKNLSLSLGYFF
jgi:hypothetical protein